MSLKYVDMAPGESLLIKQDRYVVRVTLEQKTGTKARLKVSAARNIEVRLNERQDQQPQLNEERMSATNKNANTAKGEHSWQEQ